MKKTFNLIMTVLTFAATSLMADTDIDIEDLSAQHVKENTAGGPFSVKISGDYIGKAPFDCHHFSNLTFATADLDLSFIYYYDPCLHEGAGIGLTYTRTYLEWKYNPYFTQRNYDMISVNFSGFTQRLEDWTWRAQIAVNFDNIEYWNFQDYMNYDLLLWGRYEYTQNIGIHLGILALTGMKIDRVYPVIGIDWTYDCHWKLNLIFPMDISVVYALNHSWEFSLAARVFNQRHRVKEDQFYSDGLWNYTSGGGEFVVKYTPTKWINANIHVGCNFGGHLKIADRHYHHGHRFSFNSAPYAGAEIDMNF